MFKRLAAPTGEIADSSSHREGDTPDRIVRSAVLVHSGPDGKASTLQSSDGDITFDVDRIERVVQSHNEMISKLALQYGGFEKMPVGAFPPILDQHSDDSNDRIRGRLTGLLRFETRSVPKVGDNVACAIADITFLGADTVSKVTDGRIYHLSVGIDEETNTLGEVSTVIEPAAPGAMVLNKKRLAAKATKKKLKGENKMSEKARAKLRALKGELKQLSAKAGEGKKRIELAKRKGEVATRFTKLMADKKMSPAEFKKLDLVRLAKLAKDDLESVMHVYEGREAMIKSGQQGSTSAATFSDVGTKHSEDTEVKRLKASVKKSMKLSGTKFKNDEDETELAAEDDEASKKLAADEAESKKKLEGENDQVNQVGEEPGAETKEVSEVMKMVEENSAQIARVASMVDAIIDELHGDDEDGDESDEESADHKEETEMSADDKDDKDDKEKKEQKDGDK